MDNDNIFRCHSEERSDVGIPVKIFFKQESVCCYAVRNNILRS